MKPLHPRIVLLLPTLLAVLTPLPGRADLNDLSRGKVICHLEPAGGSCTPGQSGYSCDDNVATPTTAVIHGDIGATYTLYLVALDLNTEVGLHEAAFAVDYPEELEVTDWSVCGGTFVAENEWPDSGGGVRVRMLECAGTEPDPTDPEGDGSAVLGSFQVTAYDKVRFEVKPRKFAAGDVTLTSCAGGLTDLATDDKYMVNLGFAVFGDQGESFALPCTAKGVAAESSTWGRIKSRHD